MYSVVQWLGIYVFSRSLLPQSAQENKRVNKMWSKRRLTIVVHRRGSPLPRGRHRLPSAVDVALPSTSYLTRTRVHKNH